MNRSIRGIIALILLLPVLQMPVAANRGGIPLGTVSYQEDAQNAIAAWNGKEEVLILGTDLRANEKGRLLEMLPLPSAPNNITQGDSQQLGTFIDMFNSKVRKLSTRSGVGSYSAGLGSNDSSVQILFQQSIGVHDLTVAEVRDCSHFAEWVRGFAVRSGVRNYSIGDEMNISVKGHLARGISYFVFDVVEVGPEIRSLDPLIYRFNTTYIYYPMEITAASFGNSGARCPKVNLFLVSPNQITLNNASFSEMKRGKGFAERIEFNAHELGKVSPDIQSLFGDSALAAHLYTIEGVFANDTWKQWQDVVIGKSAVQSFPSIGDEQERELSVDSVHVSLLTSGLPTVLISILVIGILPRLRKQQEK